MLRNRTILYGNKICHSNRRQCPSHKKLQKKYNIIKEIIAIYTCSFLVEQAGKDCT